MMYLMMSGGLSKIVKASLLPKLRPSSRPGLHSATAKHNHRVLHRELVARGNKKRTWSSTEARRATRWPSGRCAVCCVLRRARARERAPSMFTPQPYANYATTPARRTDQGAAGQVPATGARQQTGSSYHFPPPSGAQATSPGFGPPTTTPAQMPFSLRASGMDSIRDRAPAQGSLLSPTVPNQPLFSPLSTKPAREEPPLPAASQADELPPLQSMLDLNAGADAQAAAAGAQQATGAANVGGGGGGLPPQLPSISTDGPYWVTAFGYHAAAMIPQVLQELRPSNGEIAQHQPGAGAWLHVRFQEWRQMQEALAKNGRVRVAAPFLPRPSDHQYAPPTHPSPPRCAARPAAGGARLHAWRD